MADDCVMYKQIRSESDCLDLQKDLDILCQWENRWQMKFNSTKCFVMNITDKRNPIQHSYSMQDSVLETVDHHTYLGIEISSKLTWNLHVSNISSKANRTLGLLRRHLHSCKPNIKEIAYKSLVRPKLEFCCSIWDPYHQDQKDQLEAVQRKAARFVMMELQERFQCFNHDPTTKVAIIGGKTCCFQTHFHLQSSSQNNCRQFRSPQVFQVIQTNSSQLICIHLTQAGNKKRQI